MRTKRQTPRSPARPRPVDFANNEDDLEVAILAEAGLYTRAIARETKLTESQVSYRIGLAGVKRAHYRDGKSEVARVVMGLVRSKRTKDRLIAVRQLPEKIEILQQQYVEISSSKRKAR